MGRNKINLSFGIIGLIYFIPNLVLMYLRLPGMFYTLAIALPALISAAMVFLQLRWHKSKKELHILQQGAQEDLYDIAIQKGCIRCCYRIAPKGFPAFFAMGVQSQFSSALLPMMNNHVTAALELIFHSCSRYIC